LSHPEFAAEDRLMLAAMHLTRIGDLAAASPVARTIASSASKT
jgi:hypothetical protein